MTEFAGDWHTITDIARQTNQGLIGPEALGSNGIGHELSGHLGMTIGDEKLLLPADVDTDSATVATDDGMSIFADTDGDGQIDYVSNVSFDGHWSAWRWLGEGETGGVEPKRIQETVSQETGTVSAQEASTPSYLGEKWDSRSWKCVDRRELG